MVLEYEGPHWPWKFRAEQHFELKSESLAVELVLMNLGDNAMPAGLGLHPYFNALPDLTATYRSHRQWEISDDYLATGAFTEAETVSIVKAADWAQCDLAEYLSDWGNEVVMTYPQGQLSMKASYLLQHLVVFAPQGAPYVCVEPVSHLADGFNLNAHLGDLTGTQVVEPGKRLSGIITFAWADGP